jgi:regulatory protein
LVGPQRVLPHTARARASKSPRGSAKDRALGLLAVRWRSRRELEQRLRAAGFEEEQVSTALADLQQAGLIDDGRFARELARAKSGRLDGNRTVRSALAKAGVAPGVAEEVVSELGDDQERALTLAEHRARRLTGLDPQTAFRRLYGLLLRRGYGPDVARDASRRALAGLPQDDPTGS